MDPSQLTKNPPPAQSTMPSASTKVAVNGSSPSPTATTSNSQKMAPPSVAPRLEIQPYHEALKSALTKENWMTYTEALNKFLRGRDLLFRGVGGDRVWGLIRWGGRCRKTERPGTTRGYRTVYQRTKDPAA